MQNLVNDTVTVILLREKSWNAEGAVGIWTTKAQRHSGYNILLLN